MPEFPDPTVTFTGLVTEEVAIGFVVVQEKFISQAPCPEAMTQEAVSGIRVPDIVVEEHELPFQAVPETQEALMLEEAKTEPL